MIQGFIERWTNQPDAPALAIEGNTYSFADVMERAMSLAKILQNHDADLIGIYTDNSVYTYSSLIGILISGKGFVPLNNKFPRERIESIIEQVELGVIVGCSSSKRSFETLSQHTILADELKKEEASIICNQPDQIAYVLFTSGSTGKPKGIPISIVNFDQLLKASLSRWEILPDDRVLQAFELSFDISIGVIFMCWEKGAELVVTSFEGITAVNAYQTILENSITFAVLPPSCISYLKKFKLLDDVKVPTVRTTLFIGEALLIEHIDNWKLGAVNSSVINTYGPTEATVWCFAYDITDCTKNEAINGACPIGKPMDGTEFMIDFSKGHKDNEGELCLGGPQVFSGYINNTEKTRAVLFTDEGGKKWYRTGDIVVRNENNDLVYINRLDNQVKINGFRIELGEIEYVIRDTISNMKVVAFIGEFMGASVINVVIEDELINVAELKQVLSKKIPSYMIPKNIYLMKEMPLNNSGKIDRVVIKRMFSNEN